MPGSAGVSWLRWVPLGLMLGWWVHDLWFQWASLVEYRFGKIVVMLAGYLVWERWPGRPRDDVPGSMGASLALAGCAFPCVLVAELYKLGVARVPASSFLLSIGVVLFVAAYILQAAGPRTLRHFLFPLLFVFVAVPIPKILWNPVVFGLQGMVTFFNVEVLNLIGIPAMQQGNVIRLPNTVVGVDEACSGIRSLQSSIMAGLFIGDLVLRRTGVKVFFVAASIVLAFVGNVGRSLYLSLSAHRGGADALNAVHDTAGWSVLVFTAVGVSLLAWWITRLEAAGRRAAPGAGPAS